MTISALPWSVIMCHYYCLCGSLFFAQLCVMYMFAPLRTNLNLAQSLRICEAHMWECIGAAHFCSCINIHTFELHCHISSKSVDVFCSRNERFGTRTKGLRNSDIYFGIGISETDVPYQTISGIPKSEFWSQFMEDCWSPTMLAACIQHTKFTMFCHTDDPNKLGIRTVPQKLLNSVPNRFIRILTFRSEPYRTLQGNSADPYPGPP